MRKQHKKEFVKKKTDDFFCVHKNNDEEIK